MMELEKKYRLQKNRDFQQTYRRGKSRASLYFVAVFKKNYHQSVRIGFSVSKKYGKAVQRNLIKRRLKEILRKKTHKIRDGLDIIIIVRKNADKLSFKEIENQIDYLFNRAKLYKKDENKQ